MHERHSEALENPDDIEQSREGEFSARTDRVARRGYKAHHHETEKGNGKTGGDGPLAPDPVGDTAGYRKAQHRSQTAENREDHGRARRGLKMINDIVSDVGAEGVVGHEPEKLCAENGKQHGPVCTGHGLVVVYRRFNRGEPLSEGQVVPDLRFNPVFFDGGKEHKSGNDHQNRCNDKGKLNGPEIAFGDRGVDIAAEHKQNSEDGCKGPSKVAHNVDDAVGFGTQRLRRDVRHEGNRGVAVHHHEQQHDGHHGNHAEYVVPMEKQRDKRKSKGRHEGADEDVGHALSDGSPGPV